MKLTLTQLTAIEAVQAEVAAAQRKLAAIMAESGLDTNKPYRISPDGTVEEVRQPVNGEELRPCTAR